MTQRTSNWPEALVGLGLVAAGIVIGYEAATLNVGPLYAKVGPAAFLWFASVLLSLCGLTVAAQALREPAPGGFDLAPPLVILGGLAASIFLMEPLGFVPTAAIIFVTTARGMGSRRLLRDAVVGIVLAAAAYAVFSLGLGLRLPVGGLFT